MSISTQKQKGFALLIAIITTSMLLLVSFVVANIAYKQLLITYATKQSESAFYAADSGLECATYWDTKDPPNPGVSAFDPTVSGSIIECNNQAISSQSGSDPETVDTVPASSAIIGGPEAAANANTSVFELTFSNGTCVIVRVVKNGDGTTQINSSGYNTCSTSADRRYERGVFIKY